MGVTGALLHQDGSFFQYFEGSESGVGQVYSRIMGSRMHRGLIELVCEPADQRHFSTWSMGFAESAGSELQAISQKSCSVLNTLGPSIQWVHSYVTDNQIHCIYRAPNEAMVREHAKQGGFPADRVSEIRTIIDPTTAE